jgi:hypothetical protein
VVSRMRWLPSAQTPPSHDLPFPRESCAQGGRQKCPRAVRRHWPPTAAAALTSQLICTRSVWPVLNRVGARTPADPHRLWSVFGQDNGCPPVAAGTRPPGTSAGWALHHTSDGSAGRRVLPRRRYQGVYAHGRWRPDSEGRECRAGFTIPVPAAKWTHPGHLGRPVTVDAADTDQGDSAVLAGYPCF